MSYAPLWCKSNYSFLEGASHPDELVEEAHNLGIRHLALTDRDGVYGIVRAHKKALELGVHLVIGAQVSLDDQSHVILLAQSKTGYANLCQLVSKGRLRCAKGSSIVSWQEVCERANDVIALFSPQHTTPFDDLRAAFADRVYALLPRHLLAQDKTNERRVRSLAGKHQLAVVATTEVLYHTRSRRPLQDVLTCIRHGVTIASAGRQTKANAEHDLKSPHAFSQLFRDDPMAVLRSYEIAERCHFSLSDLRYRYPSERLPDGSTSTEWLRHLTFEGARKRYRGTPSFAVIAQLEKELALVAELEYDGYFLTMHEIVRFCREQNILCQGRGSAANSAVCFCLGITAVDPVKMRLLFERFLSRERAEPPDIDLDIEHDRCEEVIQHMYKKYRRSHAAMVANFIRYRPRSAMRDIGKALGLPETAIDRTAKLLGYGVVDASELASAGLDPRLPMHEHLVRLINEVMDFPRHLSIHPGGFLLGHEPVANIVPIENGTMADRTVIQWNKDDIEELGLFKVDLLGLGALSQLHRCFDLIKEHHGTELSMATLPADDPETYDMICRADTVGVFQIESRAQMSMLPRLRPRHFYDLVVEVSIVRPGPISGDMVHPYLRRRNGEEPVDYAHECLRPVLDKTLGIPLFQEQVMQLAVVAADYTPGEADQLRRDMAAWRRSGRIDKHRDRLVTRMQKKGIALEFAERVFNQIRGFGEYGFPESHAASFALIAYATSWLRCHYMIEFTCSLLNAQPMGFYSAATLVGDAIRHGVTVRPISVTRSDWDCTLQAQELRMGLRYVKGLSESDWHRIACARTKQPFSSLQDFVERSHLNAGTLTRLAEAGAMGCFGTSRRDALWQVSGFVRTRDDTLALPSSESTPSFANLGRLEQVHWDYQSSAHSVRGHPLAPLREQLRAQHLPDARTVSQMRDGQKTRYAGMVICRQRPGTAGGVTFMTLEDETGFVNAVIWQNVFKKHSLLLKTAPFLGITGRLQVQQGIVHLVAYDLWRPQLKSQPASPKSRDFH